MGSTTSATEAVNITFTNKQKYLNMKLIADGGSTSAKWALISDRGTTLRFSSSGVNPAVMSVDEITRRLLPALAEAMENATEPIESVVYYGAGCLPGAPTRAMTQALCEITRATSIEVASDMLGACRALLGERAGVAAILGTGSNSALYNGDTIVANTSAGGYILGDEMSGAWLGRRLASDYLKGLLPESLQAAVEAKGLNNAEIIRRVYRPDLAAGEMAPNRFLASLAPIYSDFRNDEWIECTLREGAHLFIERNLLAYKTHLNGSVAEVGFVGSVAVVFEDVLAECLKLYGFMLGAVSPDALTPLLRRLG